MTLATKDPTYTSAQNNYDNIERGRSQHYYKHTATHGMIKARVYAEPKEACIEGAGGHHS